MSESIKKVFKIRNRRHDIVGVYSSQEIIERIVRGKYNGNEEVSTEPFIAWQKLSSHPAFYDAFLKRLFLTEYKPDGTGQSKLPGKKKNTAEISDERSIVHPEPGSVKQEKVESENRVFVEDPVQATQQLIPNPIDEVDRVKQEEIEKLFLSASEREDSQWQPHSPLSESEFEQGESLKENLIERSLDLKPEIEITQPGINFSEEPYSSKVLEASSNSPAKKRLLIAGIALALSFLYLMGQSGPGVDPNGLSSTEANNANEKAFDVTGLSNEAVNKEELLLALNEEAKHFYDFDTPLHYEGALALFKEASNINRPDTSILAAVILSKAHLFEQNPTSKEEVTEIAALIEKARKAEPQLNALYRAEAILAFAQKNFELALEKIRYAVESDPTDLESGVLEAEILNELGDRGAAATKIVKIIEQKPEIVRAYFVAAKISMDMGDLDSAVKRATSALLINPMHANTHFILGEAYLKDNKQGPAIAHFDLVTKLAPLASKSILADAHFSLAKLLEQQGNNIEVDKHNKLAYYFSNGLLAEGKNKEKPKASDLSELEKLSKEQEYGSDFYSARAEEFLSAGNTILGLEYLQVIRLLEPKNPGPLLRVAEVLESLTVSNEKLKRIELLYQRAIEKDPSYLEGYCKLALIETDQYNFQVGYKLLLKAADQIGLKDLNSFVATGCRQRFPFSSESKDEYKLFIALGKHFFKRENFVCSASFFKQARQSSPVNSDIFYYFGKLSELYNTEALTEAVRYYYQAVSTDATNYDALAGWARVKTRLGDKTYVIKYVRALIENDPRNAYLFWVLGEVYAENQEYQRAITFYKKALDYNGRLSKVRISLARALSAVGQTYQAINEYSYAASTDRRNGVGFYEAAQLQTINKNYQDAELLVRALVEATPNYPGAHRLLSQIYQFQGRQEVAIEEMAKEVENNPQNTKFLKELAEVYMRYQKYEKAVGVLSKLTNLPGEIKAPEYRADRTQAFLLLSRCYRELGRPENAEGAIKLALEIDQNDPELHRELGYVYRSLQRNVEGVKQFEIYLQRNPAGTDVENIKALIKKMAIEE